MTGADRIGELYRAFAARDLDRLRSILAPDVEWQQSPGFPGGTVRKGVEAVLSGIVGAFDRDWQGWRFHPETFIEEGGTVVVLGAYRATNRSTGKAVDAQTAHVYDLEQGRVIRFRQYADSKVIHDALP